MKAIKPHRKIPERLNREKKAGPEEQVLAIDINMARYTNSPSNIIRVF